MTDFGSILAAAQRNSTILRITRRRLEGPARFSYGFVISLSKDLVLLNKLSDRIDLDGFEVLRVRDITSCSYEFPEQEFYRRALRLKKIRPNRLRGLRLDDMESLLQSAQRRFPLLVLHQERVAPNEALIGQVVDQQSSRLLLKLVTPTARLEGEEFVRYAAITRVEFGSEYENTLALVAGIVDAA